MRRWGTKNLGILPNVHPNSKWYSVSLLLTEVVQREKERGAPGWLSRLSIWLRLRSRSHSSWVRAPRQALCWWLRAWSLLRILCLLFSLPLTHSHSVSVSLKNKHKKKKKVCRGRDEETRCWACLCGAFQLRAFDFFTCLLWAASPKEKQMQWIMFKANPGSQLVA